MIDRNSKWDRQELYEKAWQVPLRKLAGEYKMSDVGLAKVCRKLEIPLPGLGHWTKIACGHTIPRPPLPEVENLPVLIRQVSEPKTPVLPEDEPKLEAVERLKASTIPTVTRAMLAHPLIEKTKLALSGASVGDRGILWAGRDVDWLDIRVSKDRLARALRLMAATLHLVEKEGFQVVVEKMNSESTSAVIYGEKIRFGVVEKSRQIKSSTTSGNYTYNRVTLEPTGVLALELWNYCPERLRRAWRDSERAKLEEHLPACLAGMMKIALAARSRRDAQEKKEQVRQKRVDEVTAELEKIEAEEKKIKTLRKEVIAWQRAKRIREYIAAVREQADRKTDADGRATASEWIEWAERQADRIDPLKPNPHSIVDDKEKVIRRLRSVEGYWWAEPLPEEEV